MIKISSVELKKNLKRYLDLAKIDTVIIETDNNESFTLQANRYLTPDAALERGINTDELLAGIEEDIREIYRKKKK